MATLLQDYLLRDLPRPRFLTRKRIVAYLRSFAEACDVLAQDSLDARSESLIESASSMATLAHARNANDRGYARESVAALKTYLLRRLAEKRKAGTADGLRAQFARFGCPTVEIVTELDLRTAGVVGGFGGNIGFFFVLIRLPHPWSQAPIWDGGGAWGGDDIWGGTATDNDQAEWRDLLRRWKPAGTSCRFVIVDEDGSTTWGPAGFSGNYQTYPINEAWEALPPYGIVTPYYNTDYLNP